MRRVVHCKKTPHDVYIGRPSEWGNPFTHLDSDVAEHRVASRSEAIARYREWLLSQPELVAKAKRELAGKVLGCWCTPHPCHGDVLAEIANADDEPAHAADVFDTTAPGFGGRKVVCLDTEYDARYSDHGVSRLACMTYSLGPKSEAQIVGPAEAVDLWQGWVSDASVFVMGHAVANDVAVLANETCMRRGAEDTVPGFGPHWEQAHTLYDARRVICTEIRQRLTQIRFGPEKASPALGALAKRLFGVDVSDSKTVPDEAQELLKAAVPYAEWPAEVMAVTPHRVLFGLYLEQHGEDVSTWPASARDYALEDVRLPWRVHQRQCWEWDKPTIPDEHRQTQSAWDLHVLSIPGWVADRERAQSIRCYYQATIAHCDRTLERHGVLEVAPPAQVTRRAKVQALVHGALGEATPLSKTKAKEIAEPTDLDRLQHCATDAKTVKRAITATGGNVLSVDDFDAAQLADMTADRFLVLLRDAGCAAMTLNAFALWKAARAKAKKAATVEAAAPFVKVEALCEPLLIDAGVVVVENKRTIKSGKIANFIFAVLGDSAEMTDTGNETHPDPTPQQRLEFCATDKKAVRQATLDSGVAKVVGVADAVEQSGLSAGAFDAWLCERTTSTVTDAPWPAVTGQVLTALGVRKSSATVIRNFINNLDTPCRVRTTYQPCVGTGRTSSRALNIQQFPRDYDKPAHLHVRGCIRPDPGWAFIIADYSQLELCSLASILTHIVRFYARDPKRRALAEKILGVSISETYESTLSRAINEGKDCHVLMASVLRGESYETTHALYKQADAKKEAGEKLSADEKKVGEDRQLSKPANFGFPGGLGERAFISYAAGYGVTIGLAMASFARRAYLSTWIEMRLYFWHISQKCKKGDGITTLRQLHSGRLRGACYYTRGCNTLFQGLAADGAKEALTWLNRAAYRTPTSPMYGTRPSGFVHDEFLVNARVEQAEAALPEVERIMVDAMRVWIPDVKIKAPGKVLYERWSK